MHAILTTPAFPPRPAQQGRAAAPAAAETTSETSRQLQQAMSQLEEVAARQRGTAQAAPHPADGTRQSRRAERTLAEVCARHLRANQPAARLPRAAGRHAGNPIREARAKAGLSQQKLAARLGITASCLHYWETDANFIGVDRLRALRAALAPHFDLEAYLAHAEQVGRTRVRAERGR